MPAWRVAAVAGLLVLLAPPGPVAAQGRGGKQSFFHGPLSVGPRAGRDFENHAWSLGGQVSLPVGANILWPDNARKSQPSSSTLSG